MTDRVSDGLVAELQRKRDDGTPRGIVWPVLADIILTLIPCVNTPEEVAATNEVLMAVIDDADRRALTQLDIQAMLAMLKYRNDPT